MARLGRGQPNRPIVVHNGRQDTPGRLSASTSSTTLTAKTSATVLTATAPTANLTAKTTP